MYTSFTASALLAILAFEVHAVKLATPPDASALEAELTEMVGDAVTE